MLITIQCILIPLEVNVFQNKLKTIIGNKNIITNIYRMQTYDSIMCGYLCIAFVDLILKGKKFV